MGPASKQVQRVRNPGTRRTWQCFMWSDPKARQRQVVGLFTLQLQGLVFLDLVVFASPSHFAGARESVL